jgi:prepilin-type N-terminal cleavage/methylation domain-containing protein
MIRKNQGKEEGVTLIELMIVLVIAVILVGGVYSLFMSQHQSYSIQDQVVGAQQDARTALDIVARDIRMAGSLVGGDGFTVNAYSYAITPNNSVNGTDSITVVDAAAEYISGGAPVTVVSVDDNNSTVTLSATADPKIFDTDKKSYVAFEGMNHVYRITNGIGSQTLTLNESPPTYIQNVGAKIFLVKAITYSVTAPTGGPGIGVLRRDENTGNGAQPLAGDGINTIVEDLQVAYQVKGSDTWIYDGIAAHSAWPASSANNDIRLVRITVIVKTVVPDPKETGFFKPACEDHGQVNTDPGNRRRIYQTVVKVRNLKS